MIQGRTWKVNNRVFPMASRDEGKQAEHGAVIV